MARQHQHPVLARVQAVAPGIVAAVPAGTADDAVVVQVHAAGFAGVDRCEVAMRVVQGLAAAGLRHFEIALLEQVGGAAFGVVVEFVEQHEVGAQALQHRRDLARALVAGVQRRITPPSASSYRDTL